MVSLDPGESYEIDMWCLPTKDDLVKWFDVIESASLIVSVDAKNGDSCQECGSFRKRLEDLNLKDFANILKKIEASRTDADRPSSGPTTTTGRPVPRSSATRRRCSTGPR